MHLPCGDKTLDLSKPKIMGILNATRDSFSDGGSYFNEGKLNIDCALSRVEQMLQEGADIIDVGGESTRPGADVVSLDEELRRVVPLVEAIKKRFDCVVSVDTSSPQVMLQVQMAGAGMINDVRALQREGAVQAAAETGLPICLMHMQGEPQTMQKNPQYSDVVVDVVAFLKQKIEVCVAAGIKINRLVVDPGFGFGKTLEHNIELMQKLGSLDVLQCPILVGVSRKSMIDKWLHRSVDQRLPGSLALALLALQRGAKIIRVHDVSATADILNIQQVIDLQASIP